MSDAAGVCDRTELVRDGLCEATKRELDGPRHWRGLTAVDAALLAMWVRVHRCDIGELHTDVMCGVVPALEGDLATDLNQVCVHSLHPLRIDACAWFEMAWWILECKPFAGHHALGQVLCYGHWGAEGNSRLVGARMGIITDVASPALEPVCAKYNVTVFETGGTGPR